MVHKVTLKKSDQSAGIPSGENLLEFLDSQFGPVVPSLCRGGTCGTCRVKLVSGQVHQENTKARNAAADAAGLILACASKVISDLVLDA
jgi:ferredoxin